MAPAKITLEVRLFLRQTVLVVMLLHGSTSWATETISPEQPPLRACAFPEPPWAYVDESGALAGIAVDLHTYFEHATGRAIRTESCTIRLAAARLREGSADLALLPEVQGLSRWAQPLIAADHARAMVLPRKGVIIHRYEDLHSLTLATPEGVDFDPHLEADPRVKKLWVTSAAVALGLLLDRRADAVVGNAHFYRFAAWHKGIDPNELFGAPLLLGERTVWVYLSRKTRAPQFAVKLRASFREDSLENLIKQLRDRYYQHQPAVSTH